MKITAEIFKQKVGREPEQDELDRCNCKQQGEIGHQSCGWCPICDKPRFMCLHLAPSKMTSEQEAEVAVVRKALESLKPGGLFDFYEQIAKLIPMKILAAELNAKVSKQ